jgi:AraC family transcriptional regulator
MNEKIYSDDQNEIRYSKIKSIEGEVHFKGFGVKYVAAGEEIYFANQKKFIVREGEYIIGNDFTQSTVVINQEKEVQGLCIDISPQIISEVVDYHTLDSNDLREFLLSDQFFVNRYNSKNTSLGYTLNEINQKISSGQLKNDIQQNELFYSLAESIITDQRFVFNHLNKMSFKKLVTNEEIFRALLNAKSFIDEHILENLSLEDLSRIAGISKYHFIRLFKNTFNVSPYQYQKRMRLEFAKHQLLEGKELLDVAISIGYADLPTFSKAFKQVFGIAPSLLSR